MTQQQIEAAVTTVVCGHRARFTVERHELLIGRLITTLTMLEVAGTLYTLPSAPTREEDS